MDEKGREMCGEVKKFRVDVSEVKTFRECVKKWEYSSRHKFHLRPKINPPAFAFGTLYHEALHAMYLGTDVDKILAMTLKEISDPVEERVMTNMITGYYDYPYQVDKERYIVLDIEFGFSMNIPFGEHTQVPDLQLCGSIDMITIDKEDMCLWGFEHKTASRFRPEVYNKMDEQPRLYYEALGLYWDAHKEKLEELGCVGIGGILLNQVKKVQKAFDYRRVVCQYEPKDRERFMKAFLRTAEAIWIKTNSTEYELPEPGYMKCQMCQFASVCDHFGYDEAPLQSILKEFDEEYSVRDTDHLEEKIERKAE